MATLGQRLKQLREKASLTQKELSKIMGFKTERSIQFVEADKHKFNHEQLIFLANYFHVSIDYLVGLSDKPNGLYKELPPDLLEWLQTGEKLTPEQRKAILELIERMNPDG